MAIEDSSGFCKCGLSAPAKVAKSRSTVASGFSVASGQFIYWKDDLLNGLDLSSSRMLWKASPALSGREYDLINSRYVFSPTDDSPNPITQDGTVWQPQSQ